jgi:hypothetical protein
MILARPPCLTLADGTYQDIAAALTASFDTLATAAGNAVELLSAAGFAGMTGDTADDLRLAIARQQHVLSEFCVKVRTTAETTVYTAQAETAYQAYEEAATRQGDTPCGISVRPAEPDLASLSAAHRTLRIAGSLDSALKNPTLSVALHSYARKHPRRAAADYKQLAANDID